MSVSAVEFRQTAWQTWQQADVANLGAHPGWVGWPKAFDPYDTLVMALAPNMIDAGLTWYTTTAAADRTPVEHPLKNGKEAKPTKKVDEETLCSVSFATKTGPSRNRMTIDHASRATLTLDVDSDDVDVFVVYDANNDGTFASDEIVGSSTGPAGTDEA